MVTEQHLPTWEQKRATDSAGRRSEPHSRQIVLLAANTDGVEWTRRRLASLRVHPSNGTAWLRSHLQLVSHDSEERHEDSPDPQRLS